ncbi:MAG: GNAT family N-acetyltransferase [Trueperaceae bacterium]|nr:GNAT family N-acetyltransferase [Trueperaceae bacterium]
MKQPELRELEPASAAAAIYELMQASYKEEARLLGLSEFYPLRRTAKDIARSSNRFLGLLGEKELRALCELEQVGERSLVIASLVVHPDAFRQGLASRLINYVLEYEPFDHLEVSTAEKNLPATQLYQKLGFKLKSRKALPEGLVIVLFCYER